VGLAFRFNVDGQLIPFRLPCRWRAVEKLLRAKRRPRKGDTYDAWARRVAWRQILRWVEAQIAMIETGMVKLEEVFLPYAMVQNRTFYDIVAEKHFLALPAPTTDNQEAEKEPII
jgi:hypothetical protein